MSRKWLPVDSAPRNRMIELGGYKTNRLWGTEFVTTASIWKPASVFRWFGHWDNWPRGLQPMYWRDLPDPNELVNSPLPPPRRDD